MTRRALALGAVAPLAVDAEGAAALIGVSRRTWHRLDLAGQVPQAIRIGRLKRWIVEDLIEWAAAGCPARDRFESMKDARQAAKARRAKVQESEHDPTRFSPRMAGESAG